MSTDAVSTADRHEAVPRILLCGERINLGAVGAVPHSLFREEYKEC